MITTFKSVDTAVIRLPFKETISKAGKTGSIILFLILALQVEFLSNRTEVTVDHIQFINPKVTQMLAFHNESKNCFFVTFEYAIKYTMENFSRFFVFNFYLNYIFLNGKIEIYFWISVISNCMIRDSKKCEKKSYLQDLLQT